MKDPDTTKINIYERQGETKSICTNLKCGTIITEVNRTLKSPIIKNGFCLLLLECLSFNLHNDAYAELDTKSYFYINLLKGESFSGITFNLLSKH